MSFKEKIKKSISLIGIFIEKWLQYLPVIYLLFAGTYSCLGKRKIIFIEEFIEITNALYMIFNNPDKISTFTMVSAILIGFYVTSMSVFGTSLSHAIIKISKNKLTKKFIYYSVTALSSAFVFLLYSIFSDVMKSTFLRTHLYFTIFIIMIIFAIRFSYIILYMYYYNINQATKVAEEEEAKKKELQAIIKSIESYLKYEKNPLAERKRNELKKEIKRQRKEAPDITILEDE